MKKTVEQHFEEHGISDNQWTSIFKFIKLRFNVQFYDIISVIISVCRDNS